ncbi:MAG: hypothetical protein R2823_04350 [Acidimicrobiia bacterium]
MRRGLGLSVAWIGATAVSVAIAAAAVGSVRSQVTEEPTALGSPRVTELAADALATTTAISRDLSTSSPTTAASSPSTSVSIPETSGATVTSVPLPPPPASQPTTSTKTYNTDGGTVRIEISGESVSFSGAVPNPGWKIEVEDAGPEQVKVRFKQNHDGDDKIEFKAEFEQGRLKISIDDH